MDLIEIAAICTIVSLVILIVVHIIIKLIFRNKSKNTVRRNIKLYVDKIEKSYRGKIDTLEPEWKKRKGDETHPVNLPFSDMNDFKNLSDLFNGAINLLSQKERIYIHKLIEIFEIEKYNSDISPSGEVINAKSIYKIAGLAKKLQDLIRKN
jgi:hypothetical protein